MTTTTSSPRLLALGVAATLALGTGTVAVAGAADGPSKAASATAATTKGPTPAKRAAQKAARQQAFAKALGVSVADVQRAHETVATAAAEKRAELEKQRAAAQDLTVAQLREKRAGKVEKRLAKAVEKGRITQAQADAVVKAVREGKPAKPALKKLRAAQRKEHRADRKAGRKAKPAAQG